MRKNKAMRLASALLVLTLLTTCAVSSTFAKYVTSTTGNDSARVAYWGFDQSASTTLNLFKNTYTNVTASAGSVDGFEKVIAPGTEGSATFAFGYTDYTDTTSKKIEAPEVAYTFKVEPKIDGTYTDLDSNPNFKWTLKKNSETEQTFNDTKGLLTAIKKLSGDEDGTTGEKEYKAGTLPDAFKDGNDTYTIGWTWDFDDSNSSGSNDATDTKMGNVAALDNVTVSITITATQKD